MFFKWIYYYLDPTPDYPTLYQSDTCSGLKLCPPTLFFHWMNELTNNLQGKLQEIDDNIHVYSTSLILYYYFRLCL